MSLLNEPVLRDKLIHGSDWPILSLPPAQLLGLRATLQTMREPNWMRRDVLIKQCLGLGDEYWQCAGKFYGWLARSFKSD